MMSKSKYINHDCKYCGKELQPKKWTGKRIHYEAVKRFNKRQYCDNFCRSKQLSLDNHGDNNYFFGKHLVPHNRRSESYWENTDSNGYVRSYTRLNDGSYLEEYKHRKVIEEHLGRKLKSDEHVHHINFDTKDNRLENLYVMTAKEHIKYHSHERINFA